MNSKKLGVLLSLMSTAAFASSLSTNIKGRSSSEIGLSTSLTHSSAIKSSDGQTTTATLKGTYQVNKNSTVYLKQSYKKIYQVESNDTREVLPGDLDIGLSYNLEPPRFLSHFALNGAYSAPTSTASKDAESNGQVKASLNVGQNFLKRSLNLSLMPYGSYKLNRYKQKENGGLQTRASLGVNLIASAFINSNFSISGLAGFGNTISEKATGDSSISSLGAGYVNFDLSSSYKISKGFSLTAGYAHSESQIKGGTYDFNVFDPEVSSWYLSTSIKF